MVDWLGARTRIAHPGDVNSHPAIFVWRYCFPARSTPVVSKASAEPFFVEVNCRVVGGVCVVVGCFVAGCGGFVAGRLEEAAAAEEARRKAAAGRKGPGGRPMPKPLVGTLPPVSAQCYV